MSSTARSTATPSSRSFATSSPTSSRSSPSTISEGQSFVDDLDADSLALIELVEALEEELGERTVGFRIEDEDLEDLKTVRDAVDYVFGRASLKRRDASAASREPTSGRWSAASATRSPTVRCCAGPWPTARGAPSSTGGAEQRAARVPRRRRARLGGRRPRRTAATANWPRASSPTCARASSTPSALADVARELDLGAVPAPRRGRGPAGRPAQAVDPLRRLGGRHRRGLPRWRHGGGATT